MLNDILSIILSAIVSFIFTSILWVNSIDENYSKIIVNKTTNNLYIEYQNNLYKLVPIKE